MKFKLTLGNQLFFARLTEIPHQAVSIIYGIDSTHSPEWEIKHNVFVEFY
ncbi:hypothetical protein [Chryseobacterium sp. Bi04]|nr:hypothetical protein [Chryseobacterium sp. Bi04]CAH0285792.1 hypothetical protein SRABI04_04190 [Chryseobacterium sp. Bi04]